MSIILKKKKGLLVPKSHPQKKNQIFGNIGSGIFGASNEKEEIINEIIQEAIENLIIEKLLLYSGRLIRNLDYFVSYNLVDGEKQIKTLYLKRRVWPKFIGISFKEMIVTGAKPTEFLEFLKHKRCYNVKITREQFENII